MPTTKAATIKPYAVRLRRWLDEYPTMREVPESDLSQPRGSNYGGTHEDEVSWTITGHGPVTEARSQLRKYITIPPHRMRLILLSLGLISCSDYQLRAEVVSAPEVQPCVEDSLTGYRLCPGPATFERALLSCGALGRPLADPGSSLVLMAGLVDDVATLDGWAWTGWPSDSAWPGCSAFVVTGVGIAVPEDCGRALPFVCGP